MASGSDVACQVSQIVLLDSDFSSMPAVVAEGRRVINNVERSASLFLVKNIFSFILTFILLFATFPYPVTVSQLSLVSVFTIGFPSFVLALEPNTSLVSGKFLRNVIKRAFPAGLTDMVIVLGVIIFADHFGIPQDEMATMATLLMGTIGLMMLFDTCKPFDKLRTALMTVCTVGFFGGAIVLANLFDMAKIGADGMYILVVFAGLTYPVITFFRRAVAFVVERFGRITARREKKKKGRHTRSARRIKL
jgi:cation-transporting ATPase E